jgi:hypothetical protein
VHRLDAEQQLFDVGLLHDVAAGAGAQGGEDLLVFHVPGEDEHLGLRGAAADLAGGLEAVEAGHHHVHEDDVGVELLDGVEGFAAVAGIADDFDFLLVLEEHAEGLAEHRVVIDDEDLDAAGVHAGGLLVGHGWNPFLFGSAVAD